MKNKDFSRKEFVKISGFIGAGLLLGNVFKGQSQVFNADLSTRRIGIIGLDTSHSEVFTRMINEGEVLSNYRVVAAYPHGSPDIASALEMKPRITAAVQGMGVKIVSSIADLLSQVDYVLLETNDGRPHYEQALQVLKAKKPMFIDKPIAHNYNDAKRIFDASRKYSVPIFTSSALRFEKHVSEVAKGKYGAVLGADVYTPAGIDPNHLDLAWYGIHGVEMLYTLLGTGCEKLIRTHSANFDVITGYWKDGRIGSVRGLRKGAMSIAGTAFCENSIVPVGPFSTYKPLVSSILSFFDTGVPPVSEEETLEMFRFMEAADRSKKTQRFEWV